MKLHIAAIGRLRTGAQKQLIDDYLDRLKDSGRPHAISAITLHELETKPAATPALTIEQEGTRLRAALPSNGILVSLDEHGKTLSSTEFAEKLGRWRDQGAPAVSFIIGGAEGLSPQIRNQSDFTLSLGPMTWPHMLARLLLAEQLYRATTIWSGHPYHKA